MATFAPEVALAVEEINDRFPKLGTGGTYPEHGEDEPGGLPSRYYSADFWSTRKDVHDEAFPWIIANADRLNLKYVISWCRIWSVERADEGVRRYFQCLKAGTSASQRHTNHIHASFNEEGFYMPSAGDIAKAVVRELKESGYAAEVWRGAAVDVFTPPAGEGTPANPTWKAESILERVLADVEAIKKKIG